MLKEEIEEAYKEEKKNKELSKVKKIIEDKKHRVSNLRSQLCRQLKKVAIILMNSLAEMKEVSTMKKMKNLSAEVKVRL